MGQKQRGRTSYDRTAVGRRICARRKQMGYARAYMAERIGRSVKYYADIERGDCGMSTDTMIDIARCLGVSLDYMMFGTDRERYETPGDAAALLVGLEGCDQRQREKALKLLLTFLEK